MVSPGCQVRDSCTDAYPGPCRCAHGKGPWLFGRLGDRDRHAVPPRIPRCDGESGRTLAKRRDDLGGRELVDLDARAVGRREVLLPRAERAHQVRRTARAELPLGPRTAVGAVGRPIGPALERVVVGEPAAIERTAAEHRVVHRPLDPVGIALVARREEQPPAQHHAGDGRAGLVIGDVWGQLERVPERLVPVAAADAPGQVHPGLDHVVPAPAHRVEQLPVTELGRSVDRAAVEVHLAHGVAGDCGRLADREMVLPVGGPHVRFADETPAAQLQHPGAELEMPPIAGRSIQLDERHFDLGMPVDAVATRRAELALDRLDGAQRDVEQSVVGEGAVPRDGGLDQVADAVELVAPGEVLVFGARGDDLDVGVEVAVRALRRSHRVDRLVGGRGEGRVVFAAELPADRLEPLVRVRIEERVDDAVLLPERLVAPRRAGRHQEVAEGSRTLEPREPVG